MTMMLVIVMLMVMLFNTESYSNRMLNVNKCQQKITTTSSISIRPLFARKIIGRDNLGDPIYDDDVNTSEGISILGII